MGQTLEGVTLDGIYNRQSYNKHILLQHLNPFNKKAFPIYLSHSYLLITYDLAAKQNKKKTEWKI